MPEANKEPEKKSNHPTAKRMRYVRDQIEPAWQEITELAEKSGLQEKGPKTPGFRKFRKEEMKKRIEIQQKGEIDSVTGILTRSGLERKLEEDLAKAKREDPEKKYAILFLDLNNLKEINDLSPNKHYSGDRVLLNTALILSKYERKGVDMVGRWGGDEFIVILARATEDMARDYWERVNKEFDEYNDPEYKILRIWISAGMAVSNIDDFGEKLRLADQAMMMAKKQSKTIALQENVLKTEKDLENKPTMVEIQE
ncbi:MAG TPA: GGDEF domain-containing protein [Patescibacteria group bacterium]|nr:GGDEF domain-containing protein [Patescibacteria group bacterium]